MNNFKRGEIYWIDSNPYRPAAGSVQSAGRPAVIVSNDNNNRFSPTLEVVFLTRAPKKDLPTHCVIRSADGSSTVLCEQITTVSSEQIGTYIRQCTPEEMREIDRCMIISLALESSHEQKQDIEKRTDEFKYFREQIDALQKEVARYKAREELLRELYEGAMNPPDKK